MASSIDMKLESQEVTGVREGSIATNTDEAKAPTPEATPSSTTVADKKSGKSKDGKKKVSCGKKHGKMKSKKGKKPTPTEDSSSESDEDDQIALSEDSSDSDSASEQDVKKKRVLKKRQHTQKTKKKAKSAKRLKKQSKAQETSSGSDSDDSDGRTEEDSDSDVTRQNQANAGQQQIQQLQVQIQQLQRKLGGVVLSLNHGTASLNNGLNTGLGSSGSLNSAVYDRILLEQGHAGLGRGPGRARRAPGQPAALGLGTRSNSSLDSENLLGDSERIASKKVHGGKRPQRLEFKRVDQVWDSKIHNYKLQDTAENASDSKYDEYLFHVRRTFDWEGKYKATIIDIKSKQLREALQDVMGNIKGVSLVEETPKLDPNMLFLYLEDLREHMQNLKDLEPDAKTKKERKKVQKWIDEKRRHLKILVRYLDKDYAQIKKSLYPLLENGLITFDLSWALWKPNTLAYTTTYGSLDEPRVFKVEVAEKHYSIVKGDFYYIEGKYFEFDGKQFGYGSISEEIGDFRGARKISSLNCYPLKYHKNESQLRQDLIERGKKFVNLGGVNYKSHQGMAYYKKKKTVIKVNINGRIMVDPSIHRRNNPNYPISLVRPKDHDLLSDDEDSDEEGGCCGCESEDDAGDRDKGLLDDDEEDNVKYVTKVYRDKNGDVHMVKVPRDAAEGDVPKEKLDKVASKAQKENSEDKDDAESKPTFTDEEYLIASPVVLGFAFAEKLWLEFTVSGVKEISWNEHAYESLVLETKMKNIVKALVESHKYHAAESIDDVIQGKGKGLVAVLHGPPGTGKTLTAEGISELLKCPLYMVSAGDLGTDSRYLEAELQKILDICHAWGAILLLDEADVFLEKRNMHDIHRNALVSIFLRQLEYFQGILFLTTNRVETFDDAFQSRIHIALRYDELDTKAKKAIFKIFIERVRVLEQIDLMPFTEEDYNTLARHNLNGRQIKNTIRTAQALAVNKGEPLSMRHIREVLDVAISFERDLKGGTGYQDAMRSYF
ncbi:uncharacterized protein BCR38DRAFT_62956 [Pseudomassariella vexata]|uniref:AAA+ ATPase domain-containing protein n=1 Tax=Pseudomassariella vexata TaxID=1141098 RepID=A0A1Y2DKG7_9PEZI|nr:uncharacterized protein BCR38DRAFT_62956 [Pseudomassariella vexata]ORY59770.1 hypothetical protein BCR38DRAFT_62956 [Pseudomassariella vexata]